MKIDHKGRRRFLKGRFEDGGHNLYVDANGMMRRNLDNNLNGDGYLDLVIANGENAIRERDRDLYPLNKFKGFNRKVMVLIPI